MHFVFSLNTGPMLKRKLQISSSTFTLKNPVRDKWAQQSHPAEDSSSRAGPADAAHDPRIQSAACGNALMGASFCVVLLVSLAPSLTAKHFLLHRDLAQILVFVTVHTWHHWATEWASSQQTTSPAPRFLFPGVHLSPSRVLLPPLLLHPHRSCSVRTN